MDGIGDEDKVENVVRFPRDWVGPRDELVPIGPRARARAREAEEQRARDAEHAKLDSRPTDDPEAVPAAGDFWGEGAAALHHAIQAPSAGPEAPVTATPPQPGDARDPRTHDRDRGARRMGRRPRLHRSAAPRRARRTTRLRRGPVIAACACISATLIVAIVLVVTGSGTHQPGRRNAAHGSFVGLAAFRSTVTAGINGLAVQVRHETHAARARALERTEKRRAAEADAQIHRRRHEYFVALRRRHAASRPPVSSQSDEPVDTATTPTETTPEATDSTSTETETTPIETETAPEVAETTPAATTPSTSDSSSSSTAGESSAASPPAGPTGVGGSTGGCNPQCR